MPSVPDSVVKIYKQPDMITPVWEGLTNVSGYAKDISNNSPSLRYGDYTIEVSKQWYITYYKNFNVPLENSILIPIIFEYINHDGTDDAYIISEIIGTGTSITDTINHTKILDTGTNGTAIYQSIQTYIPETKQLTIDFIVNNIVHTTGGTAYTYIGLAEDFDGIPINNRICFWNNAINGWYCYTQASTVTSTFLGNGVIQNGDKLTIEITDMFAKYYINDIIVATHNGLGIVPTTNQHIGTAVFTIGNVLTSEKIGIDYIRVLK